MARFATFCITLLLAKQSTFAVIDQRPNPNGIKSFPYLYGVEGDANASFPVLEHLAIAHRGGPEASLNHYVEDLPDFLFADTGTYRVVEFYVHWCDICKNFKPHYMELGRRIQLMAGPNVTIDVHAVSCAPNRPLCRKLAVDTYPYFRVFQPGDTIGIDVPHAQVNPSTILQKMGIPAEDSDDDWGLNPQTSSIDSESAAASWFDWERLQNYWLKTSPRSLGSSDYTRSHTELRDDVHRSFDYAMRQSVFVSNDSLPEDRAKILFEWLSLLRKTVPLSWTALHSSIQGLIDNFDYVKRTEDYMNAVLDEYPPPTGTVWSLSCSRGEADAGYTCGLWELFHVLTVGVVDFNRAAVFAELRLKTGDAAQTLRNYVDMFFSCEVCRRNFVESFDACAFNRCNRLQVDSVGEEADWVQLPLWLFETHNAVNIRLHKERAARESLPLAFANNIESVLWPRIHYCSLCRNSNEGTSWNFDMVYKFLKLEYGQRDAVSLEYKQTLFEGSNNKEEL